MTSTDKTRGLPLAERVETRMAELQQALNEADPGDERARGDIELALATAKSLTTGDVSHPSDVVGSQMNEWLERNKHIGIKASTPRPAKDGKDKDGARDMVGADAVEEKASKDDQAGKDAARASSPE